jgi:hypothetical protein
MINALQVTSLSFGTEAGQFNIGAAEKGFNAKAQHSAETRNVEVCKSIWKWSKLLAL